MTQVFRADGTVVPVTRVLAGPCVVTQIKTKEKDGVAAVQIGFGEQKKFRIPKAQQGHLEGLVNVRVMRDFTAPAEAASLTRGDTFTVKTFTVGDKIQVVGWSKGRGFQGVVKRHGFRGGPASHGHKDNLRMPGSIGAGGVQRVFKNMRMAGHMGTDRVTIKNLEVIEINPETNELYIKGAIPGARGGLILVSSNDGTIDVTPSVTAQDTQTTEIPNEVVEQTPDLQPTESVTASA